ncbi:hypothetical protein E2C01_069424 [Portunus trituberculatus]|uniref:Uncharacterized protein n=1 Tax=Portunus trituberculatus TaxID=210409 RepID=A0A5B7HRJ2_PORTR|nr:hypothetical protein [Portunus trituberculatus]
MENTGRQGSSDINKEKVNRELVSGGPKFRLVGRVGAKVLIGLIMGSLCGKEISLWTLLSSGLAPHPPPHPYLVPSSWGLLGPCRLCVTASSAPKVRDAEVMCSGYMR